MILEYVIKFIITLLEFILLSPVDSSGIYARHWAFRTVFGK